RLGIGINVLVQLFLTLAIFAGINRLNYRNYWRFDLSPSQTFTLSEVTLNTLDKMSRDVEMFIVFARDAKLYGDVQSLLEEYRLHGKQRIKVRLIDPVRDIERAERLKTETGLSLAQNGILIRSGINKRFITEDELVIRETGTSTTKTVAEFRGEDAVTSALINVMEGKVRRFFLIVGKGSRTEAAMADAMTAVLELGRQQNFEVVSLNMSETGAITPEMTDGIIIIGARYDFSEREIGMIADYWNSRRAGVLMLLDPNRTTKNLNQWLESTGVRPRGDRVLMARSTSTGAQKEFTVQGEFSMDTPFTRHLSSTVTTLPGQSESLALRDNDDPLSKDQSVITRPVIKALDHYWGETQYLEDLPVAEEDTDTLPPIYVGASVERGVSADAKERSESSRMVIVGNPSLLDKETMLAVNRDFVAASLNWIINREQVIGITSKPKKSYRIQLTGRQHDLIFWISSLAMPGIVLVLGFMIWAGRRAA
ncbi:MAG: GldG family protein, partial [Verrucomicrobiaceae bacterium]|nr:GldG family protein [Verrucomicrobiaceae bacterium]